MIVHEPTNPRLPVPLTAHQTQARRPQGLHLSAVLHDIAERLWPDRFKGERDGGAAERQYKAEEPRIWLGSAMDTYLRGTEEYAPVDVIQRDGIYCTCDGLLAVPHAPARPELGEDTLSETDWLIEEWKLSWLRAPESVGELQAREKYRHWLWQLMAYCWVWETLRGRLRVYFVNGTYGPPSPQYRVYECRFAYRELESNWQMIVNHARSMQKESHR